MNTVILDDIKIDRILRRIAYQIVENCHGQDHIMIVGIKPRGVWVAKRLSENLKVLSSATVILETIAFDKTLNALEVPSNVEGKTVILADDILNSGTTMMLAASKLAQMKPAHLYTACIVDRKHRKFPIHSDFTGLSLATTINENLRLVIEPKPVIYLE